MSESPTTGITVLGLGEASAIPDLMTVELSIAPRAESVASASATAREKTAALIQSLTGGGLGAEDIRTIRLDIVPEYDYKDNIQRLLGFRVTNTLRVTLRSLDMAGEIIDAAVVVGGDDLTVNNVDYGFTDEQATAEQAREAAWAHALAKAEQLASLSDRSLGPVEAISEIHQRGPAPMPRLAAVAESMPVAPGVSTVIVALEVRFSLD